MPGSEQEQEQGQEWERIREPAQRQCSPPVHPPALRNPPWCAAIHYAALRVGAAGHALAPGCGTASFFPQSRKANTSAGSANDRRVSIVTGTVHPKRKSLSSWRRKRCQLRIWKGATGRAACRLFSRNQQDAQISTYRRATPGRSIHRSCRRTERMGGERSPRPCAAPSHVPGQGQPAGQEVPIWASHLLPKVAGTC